MTAPAATPPVSRTTEPSLDDLVCETWREPGRVEQRALDVPDGGALPKTVGARLGRGVVCVGPKLPAKDILELLVERELTAVTVVDDQDRPLGVVSRSDLLKATQEGRLRCENGVLAPAFDPTFAAPTLLARDLMTKEPKTVRATASLAEAAAALATGRVHQLPVLDDGGRVVGMLDALDVAAWLGPRAPGGGQGGAP